MNIKDIFYNNRQWVKKKLLQDKNYFHKLSKNQQPKILYFGCSDSRVTAEELMGAQPGQIFVHRNIANLLPSEDSSSQSVLEFAVKVLEVDHIIVCGHYECGGIQASFKKTSFKRVHQWINPLKNLIKTYRKDLKTFKSQQEKEDFVVRMNILSQCESLLKSKIIQESRKKRKLPKIHGWIFNVRTGFLLDLFFK